MAWGYPGRELLKKRCKMIYMFFSFNEGHITIHNDYYYEINLYNENNYFRVFCNLIADKSSSFLNVLWFILPRLHTHTQKELRKNKQTNKQEKRRHLVERWLKNSLLRHSFSTNFHWTLSPAAFVVVSGTNAIMNMRHVFVKGIVSKDQSIVVVVIRCQARCKQAPSSFLIVLLELSTTQCFFFLFGNKRQLKKIPFIFGMCKRALRNLCSSYWTFTVHFVFLAELLEQAVLSLDNLSKKKLRCRIQETTKYIFPCQ